MAEAESLKFDIADIKSELRLMSRTLQQIAVQEERINAMRKCQDESLDTDKDLYEKLGRLQHEHSTCPIGRLGKDIEWVKWIVMVLTVSIVGMLFSQFGHMMKEGSDVPRQRALNQNSSFYLDPDGDRPAVLRVCIPEESGRDR